LRIPAVCQEEITNKIIMYGRITHKSSLMEGITHKSSLSWKELPIKAVNHGRNYP